jgi:hypothetical protein
MVKERRASVWITTSFPAFHKWVDAPIRSDFLRDAHRHLFHVKMFWSVTHNDRDIEFIEMKEKVDKYLAVHFKNKYFNYSCEQLAEILGEVFKAVVVEVSEDGENGATVAFIESPDLEDDEEGMEI